MIPYALPTDLVNAPLGIDWNSIPSVGSTPQSKQAELIELLWDATNSCDIFANQPIRATADVESLEGPDQRLIVGTGGRSASSGNFFGPYGWGAPNQGNGIAKAFMSHWPVADVFGAQWALAAQFPPQWTLISANTLTVSQSMNQLLGGSELGSNASDGMNEIEIAPGIITWGAGRNGYRIQIGYINGWPHAGITKASNIGDRVLYVDDVTGFLGTMPRLWDGQNSEQVRVIAVAATAPVVTTVGTVQAGPGMLSLATPLRSQHSGPKFGTTPSVAVSCMPSNVRWACYYYCAGLALTRGATAITAQALPGQQSSSGGTAAATMDARAEARLGKFQRIF